MKSILFTLITFSLTSLAFAHHQVVDPDKSTLNDHLGQVASYKVVSGNRTTRLIRSGSMQASILEAPENFQDEFYVVKADLQVRVRFSGSHERVKYFFIPKAYFQDNFITQIQTEPYVSEYIKIQYLGPAQLPSGESCQRLLMTDIKELERENLKTGLLLADAEITELKFTSVVCPNIPSIGAKYLDVVVKAYGQTGKAGLDFIQ